MAEVENLHLIIHLHHHKILTFQNFSMIAIYYFYIRIQ